MHPEWLTAIRDQCVDASIRFHFKQWGSWRPVPAHQVNGHQTKTMALSNGEKIVVANIGKKAAGRKLQDRTWDQFPA